MSGLPNADISCNAVHDAVRGFNFQLANYVTWANNEMLNNTYGMYLDGGGAKIFQQGNSGSPSDNHWENGTCTYCTSTCTSGWTGWTTTPGVYQTYVGPGAGAIWSPLYYRNTSANYNITVNGSLYPAFPYGYSLGSLNVTTSGTLPSGCMSVSSFREAGSAPESVVNGEKGYSLYPNPNGGKMSIRQTIPTDGPMNIELINSLGQKVSNTDVLFTGGIAEYSTGKVAPGLYMLILTDESGVVWSTKVIIETN